VRLVTLARRALIPEQFCPHDAKGFVVFEDGKLRCDGCHTPMVCVSEKRLVALMRTPTEVESDLRRENQRLRSVLRVIQRSIEEISHMRAPGCD